MILDNSDMVSMATTNGYGWCSTGYDTRSSFSEDELRVLNGEEEERKCIYSNKGQEAEEREHDTLHPGICPHCKYIYKKPMTLQCGHSLCNDCCIDVLSRMDSNSSFPRIRPRMGVSSYSKSSLNKTLTSSRSSLNGVFSVWRSPRCPVCGESPKKTRPVPNLTLEAFLTTIRLPHTLRILGDEGLASASCSLSSLSHSIHSHPLVTRISIRDCTVFIVGSKGVGKSSFLQSQLCNHMLIHELLGRKNKMGRKESPCLDEGPLRKEKGGEITYMLKMLEAVDVADEMFHCMGVVVMYSMIDRESFRDATRLLSLLSRQIGMGMPMVLVSTKSDLTNRRIVHSYEGQELAKQFECPFIEVSSRRNECVNEAFIELVRLMEFRFLN
ncbi:hypothetical protein PFISCL1PPCAC_15468 [Pristionchus fissidentatus]|uniref:RING-type domain-containing protein n=1 Tax=Pristionchus fissidentatus TaxID=1538716 RepID=A0AAV5W081_9BILA|nr:hypothetical protein PFISCL1PPCAC_15468 [Pristionchus fissidentatus]